MHLKKRPVVSCALFLVGGMLLQLLLQWPQNAWLITLSLAGVGFLLLRRHQRAVLLVWPLVAICGALLIQQRIAPRLPRDHLLRILPISGASLTVEVEQSRTVNGGAVIVGRAQALFRRGKEQSVSGRLRLFISSRSATPPAPGSLIQGRVKLRRIEPPANPGEFDSRLNQLRDRLFVRGSVIGPLLTLHRGERSALQQLRQTLARRLERDLGPQYAPVMQAMLLGQTRSLSRESREPFSRTGTAHLLAISGLHLGIIALWLFWVMRLGWSFVTPLAVRYPPLKAAALVCIPLLWGYTLFTGARPSTVRACAMVSIYLLALLFDRRPDPPQLIAFAVVAVLLSEPLMLFSIAFQMSVGAVVAISWGLRRNRRLERAAERVSVKSRLPLRWSQRVVGALAVSLFATLGTMPATWYHFYRLTPLSPLNNLLAVPLVSVLLLPLALLWLALCWLAPLSGWIGWLLQQLVGGLLELVDVLARIPLWIDTRQPRWPEVLALSGFSLFAIAWSRAELRWVRLYRTATASALLLCLALFCLPSLLRIWTPQLRVTALAVGQGDCTLVEFPNGKTMLIDGGGTWSQSRDPGRRIILPYLRQRGIRHIDYLVLTHRDWDHLGGLNALIGKLSIGQFWFNGRDSHRSAMKRLLKRLQEYRIPISVRKPGRLPVGEASVRFLHPSQIDSDESSNNQSLVLRVSWRRFSILLTGDIETDGEKELLKRGVALKSTILKVPHHGSTTSSHPGFLQAVSPQLAIFCVGRKNRFNFPRPTILKRYRRRGIRVLRTDRLGAIQITSDGTRSKVDWFIRKNMLGVLHGH